VKEEGMKTVASVILCSVGVLLCCSTTVHAEEPSVKKGLEEVGDAIKDDTKAAVHKTDEEMKKGLHATERGVGDAMQKTGEGMDDAGQKVHEKGE
jgi:hypothetical protein